MKAHRLRRTLTIPLEDYRLIAYDVGTGEVIEGPWASVLSYVSQWLALKTEIDSPSRYEPVKINLLPPTPFHP